MSYISRKGNKNTPYKTNHSPLLGRGVRGEAANNSPLLGRGGGGEAGEAGSCEACEAVSILSLALPAIVSNITVPLLGLVDVSIVGHLGAAAYIGAIAVGGMMFNVIYWVFGFLRMGTSGMTAQAFGRGDSDETMRLLVRSLGIAFAVALALILLQVPVCRTALRLMSPSTDVAGYAATYFYICIWGAPAMLGMFSLSGWFIGMQNSRVPMVVAISQNVINIACSLLFVFVLGMKVEGVALGTLMAQYSGFIIALCFALRDERLRRELPLLLSTSWNRDAMRRFFAVNRDIFFRTVCLVSVMFFFTSAGSWQGEVVLAVNTLLMQLYMLFSYIMDGFAYAGEALSGRYYGAGDMRALRQTTKRLFIWGGAMTALFTLAYAVGGKAFLSLLTDEPQVISAAASYFLWALLLPVAGVAAFIWDGVFIGCTATRGMLVSMFSAAVTFFIIYYVAHDSLGNHGLWLSFISFLFVRGLAQSIIAKKMSFLSF